MEGGVPTLNCLLQHTLRSLCSCSDSSSTPSKWVYAVFWRILPRNYPPPKWDHGGGPIDRAKGNKRNWILVWEDGFCDFYRCERGGDGSGRRRFGADVFFKMTHEVYNFGEGMVGKVASDNSHKWVYRDTLTENDPTFISSWNASIETQPRAWEAQFSSGIETIALISVREGAIQLGSLEKVAEDLNMVLNIQRKFSYLQNIPGIYTIQRPYALQNPGLDRRLVRTTNGTDEVKTPTYMAYNTTPQNCSRLETLPFCSVPPLLPSNLGAFFPKVSSLPIPYYAPQDFDHDNILLNDGINFKTDAKLKLTSGIQFVYPFDDVKEETGGAEDDEVGDEKHSPSSQTLGFEPRRGEGKCCNS